MNRWILGLGLCAAVASSAAWCAEQSHRTVSVSGDAEIRVIPDEVVFTLGVTASGRELLEVKKLVDQRLRDVSSVATTHGIAARDIQTDYLTIERDYATESSGAKRTFIGYVQRSTVVVTLRDINRFEAFLTAVLQAGVESVHGIDFRTSQLRKHRDEARALAIRAAREKAVALAGELGEKIGRPRSIQESQNTWWSSYRSWWGGRYQGVAQNVSMAAAGGSQASSDNPLAPGALSVRAVVNVTFDLQ